MSSARPRGEGQRPGHKRQQYIRSGDEYAAVISQNTPVVILSSLLRYGLNTTYSQHTSCYGCDIYGALLSTSIKFKLSVLQHFMITISGTAPLVHMKPTTNTDTTT